MPVSRKQLALQTVIEAFETAKLAREPYETRWNEYYRLANSIPNKVKHKWMTNRFIPYTAAILDLILPRLAAKRPGATVIGLNEESGLKQQKFDDYLNYQQDKLNIDTLFADWIYDTLRYGTSFLKVGWKKETAQNLPRTAGFIQKIKTYFMRSLGLEMSEDDMLYDGPVSELVDIFDVFVHPKARNRDDALYMIHRMEQTKYDLRQNPNYKNTDLNDLQASNLEIDEFRKKRLMNDGLSTAQASRIVEQMGSNYHEILEYWGLFDIDGNGEEEECVITIADRKKVIRLDENPYYCQGKPKKPFVVLKYRSEPHFFYGKGVVERTKSLQEELNDIANQASDMRKLTLMPVMKVKRDANIDVEKIKVAPGMPIALDNPSEDLIFERPPDFTSQLEFVAKSTREVMQIATGANDVVTGQGDVGIASDTATGAQIASEQTALRFRLPALMLDSAIEDFGTWLINLNQQFHDRKKRIATGNGTYMEITPQTLAGQFAYKVETMSMAPVSKSVRRTELVNLKQLLMQNPRYDQNKIDDMIVEQFDIDADTISQPPAESTGAIGQFNQLDPQQQQAFLAKLNPTDRAIMERALAQGVGNGNQLQGAVGAVTPGGENPSLALTQ